MAIQPPTPKLVKLPSRFQGGPAVGRFLSELIGPDQKPRSQQFEFDFSELRWIDGDAITSLSNVIQWLLKRRVRIKFSGLSVGLAGVKYLDDSQFFRRYLGKPISQLSSLRPTTIPLELVAHKDSFSWLNLTVVPWLASRLRLSEASFSEFKTCLYEVFNNIKDHSGEDIGCVFIQFHPQIDEIHVSISDFGMGIPASMRETFPNLSDSRALLESAKEGVTSKRHGRNLGAGLHLLIQNVVLRNGGRVEIRSNFGRLDASLSPDGRVAFGAIDTNYFYPGTSIKVVLRTDTIEVVDEDWEDLEW